MADFASQAGHYYHADGSPAYTIIGANGKERDTTLRDARKLGLYPSVTGIIKLMHAEGLQRYFRRQLALALLTLPRIEGESADSFLARAEEDAAKEGLAARDRGIAIHAAIEQYFAHGPLNEFGDWVLAAHQEIFRVCGECVWSPEKAFCRPDLGYGGKADLHCLDDLRVIDIKTKADDQNTIYPEHAMQLAACRMGLGLPNASCGILFVNRNEPKAQLIQAEESELAQGWEMFKALVALHRARTGHRP